MEFLRSRSHWNEAAERLADIVNDDMFVVRFMEAQRPLLSSPLPPPPAKGLSRHLFSSLLCGALPSPPRSAALR